MSREMKHSGIPWIGEIPKEWGMIRIKRIFEIVGGNGFKDKYQGKISGDYPFYKTSDINGDCDYVSASSNYVDRDVVDIENYNIVPMNSIVVSKIGAAMRKNHRKITACDCCIDNNLQALHPIRTIDDTKYLYYLLKVINFEWFDNNGTIPSVNNAKLKDLYVPWISLSEQQKIASYLDKKCSEIDEMVVLQEKIIEELKAYKQSVITEAVTKGLNPDVPMKDSGIEWIGEIPESWEVCRMKNVAELFGRIGFRGYTSEDLNKDGEGAITLSPSNMLPMGMDYSNVTYLSWFKYHESPEIKIQNGDILMVKTGSSYGKVSYVEDLPKEATINPQILRIVSKINSKYLGYYMQTTFFTYQVEGSVVGGTIPTISQEKIYNFYVLLPPLSEQQSIASYLDEKCSEIDNLISIKQSKIESLKEYKKSIIYEYVTGKKEVI